MLRRVILLSLVIYLVQSAVPAYAQRADQTTAADKTRAAIAKLGTCPGAKVESVLQGTKATYDEVAQVKRRERPVWKLFAVAGAIIALPMIPVAVSLRGS